MKTNISNFQRVIIVLFIMLSFNVIAALAASAARNRLDYEPLALVLVSMAVIVAADLIFLYLLLGRKRKIPSGVAAGSFEALVQKYYNGDNWEEAFKRAYDEWHRR